MTSLTQQYSMYRDMEDKWLWRDTVVQQYIVKSAYNKLKKQCHMVNFEL